MGQVTEYAEGLVSTLQAAGVGRVTTNIRNAIPPCVLVVPVPRRVYDTLDGGYTAAFSIVALAPGPGDLSDAKALEDMVDAVSQAVGVWSADPVSYLLPNRESPAPAYLMTHNVPVDNEE